MIYIVTPCSRPQNLPRMKASIPQNCAWAVVADAEVPVPESPDYIRIQKPGLSRKDHPFALSVSKNLALETLPLQPDDWVYILDDDNIIHPDWFKNVAPLCTSINNALSWGQLWRDGRRRLSPTPHPRVGAIDTASYMWRYGFKPELRFQFRGCEDGRFAVDLGTMSCCLMKNLCYYNYLR